MAKIPQPSAPAVLSPNSIARIIMMISMIKITWKDLLTLDERI